MATQATFWGRLQDEVRSVSDRARRTTRRAVQIGVLQVDLVSLRRDRARTLARLGERAAALWTTGALASLQDDPDAIRARDLLEGIERCIASKEAELDALRKESDDADDGPTAATASSTSAATGEAPAGLA
jgi:hypothetical protein